MYYIIALIVEYHPYLVYILLYYAHGPSMDLCACVCIPTICNPIEDLTFAPELGYGLK